jgi:hypothetical protein
MPTLALLNQGICHHHHRSDALTHRNNRLVFAAPRLAILG